MSVSYYCPILCGIFISDRVLDKTTEQTVRGCVHPLVAGANFCPTCGEPIFKKVQASLRHKIAEEEFDEIGLVVASNDLSVSPWGSIDGGDTRDFEGGLVIGVKVPTRGNGLIEFDQINPSVVEEKIKEKLESLNISMDIDVGLYRAVTAS